MKVTRCDQCKEDIESGETYYDKPRNHWAYQTQIGIEEAQKSMGLEVCTGCFAKLKRELGNICPQLLNDFIVREMH